MVNPGFAEPPPTRKTYTPSDFIHREAGHRGPMVWGRRNQSAIDPLLIGLQLKPVRIWMVCAASSSNPYLLPTSFEMCFAMIEQEEVLRAHIALTA
jgi:hypothetical protein